MFNSRKANSYACSTIVLLLVCNVLPCKSSVTDKLTIEKQQFHRDKRASWIFVPEIVNGNPNVPGIGGMEELVMPSGSDHIPVSVKPPTRRPTPRPRPKNPSVPVTRPPEQIFPNTCQLICDNPYQRSGCIVNVQQCRCPYHHYQTFCANDGVTYKSPCWLHCARRFCNAGLTARFEGVCAVQYNPYG
ncbi:unnamed protein product [Orchesella dallaii]|uniref:Kazal-like domain-containing protein n=1 Tax=Orchesella dallaii TaxID=48710 RepID=A0ABP1QQ57_9HEXA